MADEYYAPARDASTSPYADAPRGSGTGPFPSRPAPAERSQQPGEKKSRRRAPKACGECRRLKLKCDRVFPCQSCVKRGCEGICPDGSLVSGRGSRYILANTEQLHEKIVVMGDRIRDLEDALRVMSDDHAQCPDSNFRPPPDAPHPLLREELLQAKSSLELYGLSHPNRAATNVRRSPSASLSDESDLDGSRSRFSNPQNLLTPQSELTDARHQYFTHPQGSSSFSSLNNQPLYGAGNTYDSAMVPSGLGSTIISPLWDPDSTSPTSRTDMQQNFPGPYSSPSSAVAPPHQQQQHPPQQHLGGFSGGDMYQAPPAHYQQPPAVSPTGPMHSATYPPMHMPSQQHVRSVISDEDLLRRYRA